MRAGEHQDGASVLAVLDTIASADIQQQDPSARQELEHSVPQQAASLAASMRRLAETKAGEIRQRIHAKMADTQQTFDTALQEHRFTDAAHAVDHLRRELDDSNMAGVILPALPDATVLVLQPGVAHALTSTENHQVICSQCGRVLAFDHAL